MMTAATEQEIMDKSFHEGADWERRRIGRELHDGLGSLLFGLGRQLQYYAGEKDVTGAQVAVRLTGLVQEATATLRNAVHNLLPETVALRGIRESLESYNRQLYPQPPSPVTIHCHGDWTNIDQALQYDVFRMAQELLRNMARHARAGAGSLTLLCFDDGIRLLAEDDGIGCDMHRLRSGAGLRYLQARVHARYGTVELESAPGKGASCRIFIPRCTLPG